jgi:DNA primase large subunit
MKAKILLFNLLLLIVSCKAQTTYGEETLKKQSEKITNFQQQKRIAKSSKITIGDIVSKLDVPIISFSFETESWESNNVNLIKLKFFTDKEFYYKNNNNLKLYYIYLKNPVKSEVVLQLIRKNQGKWTKEVNDYFKDMEVESVKAN